MSYIKKIRYDTLYAMWESLVKVHLSLHKIDLPDQQIVCLVTFCMFGINETTYSLLVERKIVPKRSIINNYKTLLKDQGLIIKIRSKQWQVCDDLRNLDLSKSFDIIVSLNRGIEK